MRIPTPFMFALTVIRYELITYLVFSDNGYGEILLRRIGVFHPIVIISKHFYSGILSVLTLFVKGD